MALLALLTHQERVNALSVFVLLAPSLAIFSLVVAIFWLLGVYRQKIGYGPPAWPILGTLPEMLLAFPYLYDWATAYLEASPTMTYISLAPGLNEVVTANPKNLEHILKTNFANYPKGPNFQTNFEDLLGHGIFNSDDDVWRQQRKTASLEFSQRSLRDLMMVSIQEELLQRFIPTLEEASMSRTPVDLQDILLRYTFDNICRIGFGVDPGCLEPGLPKVPFARAFDEATKATLYRNLIPEFVWKAFRFLRLFQEGTLYAAVKEIDSFAEDVIRNRRTELASEKKQEAVNGAVTDHSDILSRMMLLEKDDGGQLYSERFLRDVCTNFILAGRDTSSVLMTWLFWLLTWHPSVEEKILAEVQSIVAVREGDKSFGAFTYEELKQMKYVHAAIAESLRLYPSVPADFKHVVKDDVLPDGTHVKSGWRVQYELYAMGRMTRIWGPDARDFKPERWFDSNGELVNESPFKFPAFNAGPRLCLGRDLAYLQMKSIVASTVRLFRLELVPGHKVEYSMSLTLSMTNGLKVFEQLPSRSCHAQRYRAAPPRAALLPRVLRCCPYCPARHAPPCPHALCPRVLCPHSRCLRAPCPHAHRLRAPCPHARPALLPAPRCLAARAPPCPAARALHCPAAHTPCSPMRCPARVALQPVHCPTTTATTATATAATTAPQQLRQWAARRGRSGTGAWDFMHAGGTGQHRQSHRQETLSPQQLREWVVHRGSPGGGGYRARGAGGIGQQPPSGSLTGFHLPSFSKKLVINAVLQDQFVTLTTPGGELVAIYTDSRTSEHLATFTRSPGSGLYKLTTKSAQVAMPGQLVASCSCRLLSHQTLLWHHRLGHPSLPRLRGMHSRLLVSGLPRSLPLLPRSLAPPCLPCVEGRQRAAPHSSFPSTTAPLQTLHMDSKAGVRGVLIDWIIAVRRQPSMRFQQDLPVLRLHSDRGSAFSSGLLRDFCRAEGIAQSFMLPASPWQNGIAECRIGLVMEVSRTSMIHAAAHNFLWPFAIRYATHQLNLWPHVSVPETSSTLRWSGEVGDASAFRVWGALSLIRDTTAGKLSSRTLRCGPSPSGMSQVNPPPLDEPLEVSSDTSGLAERGDPAADDTATTHRSPHLETPPGFLPRPSSPPLQPVAVDSGAAGGGDPEGVDFEGAGPRVADSRGAESGGAGSGGAYSGGTDTGGAASLSGGGVVGAPAGGYSVGQQQQSCRQETLSPQQLRDWVVRRGSLGGVGYSAGGARAGGTGGTIAAGAGGTGAGGAGGDGAAGAGGTGAAGARGARAVGARGTRARGAGGIEATSARGARAGGTGGTGAGGTGATSAGGAGGARAGGTGGTRAGGARAIGAGGPGGTGPAGAGGIRAGGAGGNGAGGTGGARAGVSEGTGGAIGVGAADGTATAPRQPFFYPQPQTSLPPPNSALRQVLSHPSSTGLTPPLLCPSPDQSQPQLLPGSPVLAPFPYPERTGSLAERREPESCPASPFRTVSRARRPRPPPVPDTIIMALRPSSVPLRVALPSPLAPSLSNVPDPESDLARVVSPTITRLLTTVVTDPSFESTAASALVIELVNFATTRHLDYVASLVTESESVCPPSIGGELALCNDVLEDKQFQLECLAIALPRFASMLLCPEGDPDALNIPTPRSYAEAITSEYSSQWQTTMDAEMASWKPTGTYVDKFSSPQSTPLPTGHSLSAPPSDESVEPSGPCAAKIYAGAMAAQEICWLTYLPTSLARETATGRLSGVSVVLSRKKEREAPESSVKVCKAAVGAVPERADSPAPGVADSLVPGAADSLTPRAVASMPGSGGTHSTTATASSATAAAASTTAAAASTTSAAASTTSTATTKAPTPGTTPTTTATPSASSTASATAPAIPSTTRAPLALAVAAPPIRSRCTPDLLCTNEVDGNSRSNRGEKGDRGTPLKERGATVAARSTYS
ncbi:unnamed protein product [Closterium sp. NIES-54]